MAEHEPDDVHMAAESDIEDDLDDLDDDLHWVLGFPEPALHPCDLLRHAFHRKWVGGRRGWTPCGCPLPTNYGVPWTGV